MDLYHKNQQGSRHVLKLLLISLVCSFFYIALAQLNVAAKAFDSLDFPLEGITCLANILVFSVTLIRARFDLENAAREVLGYLICPKLEEINGSNGKGLSTCIVNGDIEDLKDVSVVMLSKGTPNSSMKQFLKSNAVDDVHSILLQYVPFDADKCQCKPVCNCITVWTREDITSVLAARMPRTLKLVNDSLCLLPCRPCLTAGCHGCNQEGLLPGDDQPDEGQMSRERVVPCILDEFSARSIHGAERRIGICIPLHDAESDKWTEKLVRTLRSKDEKSRGVRVKASEALEGYLDGNGHTGSAERDVHYNLGSFILPRLSEIIITFVLTFWFTVDGFSSSLAARRTVRDYLVGSKGSGLAANAFLTKATVRFDANKQEATVKNNVFQVLTFRGNRLSFVTLSFIAGVVNMICCIGWAVVIPFEGGDSAPPLSIARVVVIIAAIGIALIMDCLYLFGNRAFFGKSLDYKVSLVIISEIVCIVTSSVLTGILGINVFGKWVYSALQLLVLVKWGVRSYILDQYWQEISSGYKNDEISSGYKDDEKSYRNKDEWLVLRSC